ncbi:diguanylate cyclase domain-containing protein [Cohnella cellulosilytica]|uniref:Diguanylate cyclase domain-containing protein n=1 Tax=Cohnella cellulosilytica TaxID=986710 RepID=A0ABW2FGG0_9BACL
MNPSEVWTYVFAYLLPILFFAYMGTDVIVRNPGKVEHRLIGLTSIVYILLFAEEYVRHQLPLSDSPALVALWFSNVGIAMPGLGLHFLTKFSGLDKHMPRYLYPAIFYLPLVVIVVNVLSRREIISSSEFISIGAWKYPVYDTPYYAALTVSILISTLYLVFLNKGSARAVSAEHRAIYRLLVVGVLICTCWHVAFGYFQFEGLPPYSYLYGGVIWCFTLRLAMIRYEFLDYASKRYEKLFNLNPAAILLVEQSGKIKEANPSARKLIERVDTSRHSLFRLVGREFRQLIKHQRTIRAYETSFHNGERLLHVLIDGDYVSVDNAPHLILIVRDITEQKEGQEQIRFLAFHDPLTRLPNRRYFYEKLEEAIRSAEKDKLRPAVVLIDLDRFKETNDKHGHEAGDEVLRHVARMIGETAEPIGMAARLGGDEFVLFIRHAPSPAFVEETIARLEERIREEKLIYREHHLPIYMSIGAGFYPDDGRDADALLMSADKAMYRVKRARKTESAGR